MEANDLVGTIISFVWVLIFIVISEGLARKEKISKETSRKILHISVGQVIFFLPFFETWWIAAGIPFVFVFGNYLLSPISPIAKLRLETYEAGHTFGTILYPLSLSIVTAVFFETPFTVMMCFFPVVFGDGLAAVFGQRSKSKSFILWSGEKTVIGTLTVFLASIVSIIVGAYILTLYTSLEVYFFPFLLDIIIVSFIATLVELFSPKGTDNLFIPLILLGVNWMLSHDDLRSYILP